MTINSGRKAFIEMMDTFNSCAQGQKTMSDETFQKCFNCTKDQALLNNIKILHQQIEDLEKALNK